MEKMFLLVVVGLVGFSSFVFGGEMRTIKLLEPLTDGGKPLMLCLKERKSSREFSKKELPPQVLSNLLWAANGANRSDGRRTAPTARNMQEIDVYVVLADGLYIYNAKNHSLEQVLSEDIRPAAGSQPFVKDSPVNLIFVSDFVKMGGAKDVADFYSATDTGYVSQNVYLFCASEGLATVVRGSVDRKKLHETMKLKEDQKIILTQTVGYPK